jgi:hypothetical protein
VQIEKTKNYCAAPQWVSDERPLLVHHVAELIGRKNRMVRYLAQTGRLQGFKLGEGGKIWAFSRRDVNRFLDAGDQPEVDDEL